MIKNYKRICLDRISAKMNQTTENRKKTGEILLDAGLISKYNLDSAISYQKIGCGKLASTLIQLGFIDEQSVISVLESRMSMSCVTLDDKEIPQEIINLISPELAEKHLILPLALHKKNLSLAMTDPLDLKTIDELTFSLGLQIKPVFALESSLKNAISRHYHAITFDPSFKDKPVENNVFDDGEDIEILRFENSITRKTHTKEAIIHALIELLIEKGIITRSELLRKIRKKSKK
jgi:type IV pilus assembly protein PilB